MIFNQIIGQEEVPIFLLSLVLPEPVNLLPVVAQILSKIWFHDHQELPLQPADTLYLSVLQ